MQAAVSLDVQVAAHPDTAVSAVDIPDSDHRDTLFEVAAAVESSDTPAFYQLGNLSALALEVLSDSQDSDRPGIPALVPASALVLRNPFRVRRHHYLPQLRCPQTLE